MLTLNPDGEWAGEALFRLAKHQIQTDTAQGLDTYARLRALKGPHDRVDSAHFLPAIALIRRAQGEDLQAADKLLRTLLEKRPNGPYTLNAIFWRGRIAEAKGDLTQAAKHFQALADLSPYDYFALRARMHLTQGANAAHAILPNAALLQEIGKEYRAGSMAPIQGPGSAYSARLVASQSCELYTQALAAEFAVRTTWPDRRLEDLELEELDTQGLLTSIAVLFALRQDALAAKDVDPSAENRMQIAGLVSSRAKDWPLAFRLVGANNEPLQRSFQAKRDPHYLATTYPPIYPTTITQAAEAHKVPPALLYAMIRNESSFYSAAYSRVGAIGLIQMMPGTFDGLNDEWRLIASNDKKATFAYLMDTENAIQLGARWLKEKLLPPFDGNPILAAMAHNAGIRMVNDWKTVWHRSGGLDDLELISEMVPFGSTRGFAHRVLRDYIIAEASGMFEQN